MAKFFIITDDSYRKSVIDFISALNLNRAFSVEIKQYVKNRSMAQNRTYWMWLEQIASETGNTRDDLHEHFKARILGVEEKTVLGRPTMIAKSTAGLNTKDFTEYLRTVEGIATSIGIRLNHPDDYRYAMMMDDAA